MRSVLLHSILLTFSVAVFAQEGGFIEDMSKKWKNAMTYTLEIAELMPEKYYNYKPTEDEMSFHDQMRHIVSNMNWLSSSYLGGKKLEKDLRNGQYSKDEMLALLKEGFELSLTSIEQLDPAKLGDTVKFFAGPMHIRQILTLMNDHVTHHRAQAVIYVRLQGLKPPGYKGW